MDVAPSGGRPENNHPVALIVEIRVPEKSRVSWLKVAYHSDNCMWMTHTAGARLQTTVVAAFGTEDQNVPCPVTAFGREPSLATATAER
jgi:hypothetical protein